MLESSEGFSRKISLMFYILVYAAAGVALWFARRPSLPRRVSAEELAEA